MNLGNDVEKLEPSYVAGGTVKWCSLCGRQFLKKLNIIHSSQSWEQPKCPSTGEWINKIWSMHTVEYYSVRNKEWNLVNGTAGVNLENIIRSEISQAQRKILDDSTYIQYQEQRHS